MRFLLDTNVLIEELAGKQTLTELPAEEIPAISAITITEMLALPGLEPHEEARILSLLERCLILPVDFEVAARAGRFQRTRQKKSVLDLLIAATALAFDCVLVTKNVRDFKGIPDLQIWGSV